jgi:hypothetical protein
MAQVLSSDLRAFEGAVGFEQLIQPLSFLVMEEAKTSTGRKIFR